MTIEAAIEILQSMFIISFTVLAPILGLVIVVGLTVSLIQTVTSIQEQTLVFVPKLLAVGLILIVAGHWMLTTLTEFGILTIQQMSEIGRGR